MEIIKYIPPITAEKSASYAVRPIHKKSRKEIERDRKLTLLLLELKTNPGIVTGCTDPRIYEAQKKSQSINPIRHEIKPIIPIKNPVPAKPSVKQETSVTHKIVHRLPHHHMNRHHLASAHHLNTSKHFHPKASKKTKINTTTAINTYGPPALQADNRKTEPNISSGTLVVPNMALHGGHFIYPGENILLGNLPINEKTHFGLSFDVIESEMSKQEPANDKAGFLSYILYDGENSVWTKKIAIKTLAYKTIPLAQLNNPDNNLSSIITSTSTNGWSVELALDEKGKLVSRFVREESGLAYTIRAGFESDSVLADSVKSLSILKTYPKDNGKKIFFATDELSKFYTGIMDAANKIEILQLYNFQ